MKWLLSQSLWAIITHAEKENYFSWDRVFELKPNSPADELGVCFEIQREWIENIESLT